MIKRVAKHKYYNYTTHRYTTKIKWLISLGVRKYWNDIKNILNICGCGFTTRDIKELLKGMDKKARKEIIDKIKKNEYETELREVEGLTYEGRARYITIEKFLFFWLKCQINQVKTERGYEYKIILKQENKPEARKEMRLIHSHVRREHRGRERIFYRCERVFWITIDAIIRMKSMWGFHSGKVKIKIIPL